MSTKLKGIKENVIYCVQSALKRLESHILQLEFLKHCIISWLLMLVLVPTKIKIMKSYLQDVNRSFAKVRKECFLLHSRQKVCTYLFFYLPLKWGRVS